MGKYIVSEARAALSSYLDAYKSIITLAGPEPLDEKNIEAAVLDIAFLERSLTTEEYAHIRECILNFAPKSLSRSGGFETDFIHR
jgi:hypothetical protein